GQRPGIGWQDLEGAFMRVTGSSSVSKSFQNAETIGYVDLDGMSGPARNGAALVMFYLSEDPKLAAPSELKRTDGVARTGYHWKMLTVKGTYQGHVLDSRSTLEAFGFGAIRNVESDLDRQAAAMSLPTALATEQSPPREEQTIAEVRDVVSHGETEASSVHLASESESERKAKAMPKTELWHKLAATLPEGPPGTVTLRSGSNGRAFEGIDCVAFSKLAKSLWALIGLVLVLHAMVRFCWCINFRRISITFRNVAAVSRVHDDGKMQTVDNWKKLGSPRKWALSRIVTWGFASTKMQSEAEDEPLELLRFECAVRGLPFAVLVDRHELATCLLAVALWDVLPKTELRRELRHWGLCPEADGGVGRSGLETQLVDALWTSLAEARFGVPVRSFSPWVGLALVGKAARLEAAAAESAGGHE
ncbi:unnamed protein product, partial [Effrenium voratum]